MPTTVLVGPSPWTVRPIELGNGEAVRQLSSTRRPASGSGGPERFRSSTRMHGVFGERDPDTSARHRNLPTFPLLMFAGSIDVASAVDNAPAKKPSRIRPRHIADS